MFIFAFSYMWGVGVSLVLHDRDTEICEKVDQTPRCTINLDDTPSYMSHNDIMSPLWSSPPVWDGSHESSYGVVCAPLQVRVRLPSVLVWVSYPCDPVLSLAFSLPYISNFFNFIYGVDLLHLEALHR